MRAGAGGEREHTCYRHELHDKQAKDRQDEHPRRYRQSGGGHASQAQKERGQQNDLDEMIRPQILFRAAPQHQRQKDHQAGIIKMRRSAKP